MEGNYIVNLLIIYVYFTCISEKLVSMEVGFLHPFDPCLKWIISEKLVSMEVRFPFCSPSSGLWISEKLVSMEVDIGRVHSDYYTSISEKLVSME